MDMTCLNPSSPSGTFTLLAVGAAFVLGALGYHWLLRNKPAELEAAEEKLKDLDDKRRGG